GVYEVKVFEKEKSRLVAIFTGQVYRKEGGLEGFNI
ncbi:MAG TPA: phenylacetic acid degradation protein, partial [Thermodesulfobacterium commune]|nr:phenylacetic acid degradation protein [Thermodesulfobacterium commune]